MHRELNLSNSITVFVERSELGIYETTGESSARFFNGSTNCTPFFSCELGTRIDSTGLQILVKWILIKPEKYDQGMKMVISVVSFIIYDKKVYVCNLPCFIYITVKEFMSRKHPGTTLKTID